MRVLRGLMRRPVMHPLAADEEAGIAFRLDRLADRDRLRRLSHVHRQRRAFADRADRFRVDLNQFGKRVL